MSQSDIARGMTALVFKPLEYVNISVEMVTIFLYMDNVVFHMHKLYFHRLL